MANSRENRRRTFQPFMVVGAAWHVVEPYGSEMGPVVRTLSQHRQSHLGFSPVKMTFRIQSTGPSPPKKKKNNKKSKEVMSVPTLRGPLQDLPTLVQDRLEVLWQWARLLQLLDPRITPHRALGETSHPSPCGRTARSKGVVPLFWRVPLLDSFKGTPRAGNTFWGGLLF